jgi:hypothetical protein
MIDEITLDELTEDFYGDIMPDTRKKIRAHIKENQVAAILFDVDHLFQKALFYLSLYQFGKERDNFQVRYFAGEMLKGMVSGIPRTERLDADETNTTRIRDIPGIVQLWARLKRAQDPGKEYGRVTDEDKQKAKDYPIESLVQFKRGVALCPFHGDKTPSMNKVKNENKAHCFSCNQTWDSIDFVRQMEGLDFEGAVKFLIGRDVA